MLLNTLLVLLLTIALDRRDTVELNYSTKIDRLKKRPNPWLSYELTPFEKVYVLKSEALSQLVYLMSVLPMPSVQHTIQLETIMFKFIWGNTEKIKRSTMKNLKSEGGLQEPDIVSQANSLTRAPLEGYFEPPPPLSFSCDVF